MKAKKLKLALWNQDQRAAWFLLSLDPVSPSYLTKLDKKTLYPTPDQCKMKMEGSSV